ncbi:heavy metal transporter [Flagellimonas aquimarina]|uniref:Heavy metal transporter n=1 Tax=Flagellimonas aquimarina TaxID=2201895 RepID=A0A316L1V5_9FLAO|nr:heavy-metal-associated domain-containing protein [Allomuricauda koreensis]PWL40502.1 heavy metal transporter [Allomuricauda koreensis]
MKTTLQIQNLKCGGCSKTIKDKLSKLDGIDEIMIDQETSSVIFKYQDVNVIGVVKDRLRALGYPAIDDENGILQKAKSFVSCANGKFMSS